jgi:hypothetical protein
LGVTASTTFIRKLIAVFIVSAVLWHPREPMGVSEIDAVWPDWVRPRGGDRAW